MAEITPAQREVIKLCMEKRKELSNEMNHLSNVLGHVIEPLLDQNNLEIDEQLRDLVDVPCYWQFEIIRRIRALRKLRRTNGK